MPQPLEKHQPLKFLPFLISNLLHKSAMTINPDNLICIICIMAFIFGPCLFIILYTTAYKINITLQYFFPEHQPPIELGPETLVGCPDGLCYLPLFIKGCHSRVINQISCPFTPCQLSQHLTGDKQPREPSN